MSGTDLPRLHSSKESTVMDKGKKQMLFLLFVLLFLQISSYFTLFPDSIMLTRLFKIALRLGVLAIAIVVWLYWWRIKKDSFIHFDRILPIGFYLCYLLMGLASLFWTTNLSYSVLQLIMTFQCLIFVVVFYQIILYHDSYYQRDEITFSWLLNRCIFLIALIFIAGNFIDPETFNRQTHGGVVARLGGFIINPNELGMLLVVGIVTIIFELYHRRWIRYNLLALTGCFSALLMTQSRSSLIAFAIVLLIYVVKSKSFALKFATGLASLFAFPFLLQKIFLKENNWQEILTFTDRLPFWQDLLCYAFPKSPLVGFGFMSISSNEYSNKFMSLHAYAGAMTHNTFLQVLINLGFIGAAICLLQMTFTFIAVTSSTEKRLQLLVATLFIPLLINSMTEFGIFGEHNHGVLFYQFIILFFTLSIRERDNPI